VVLLFCENSVEAYLAKIGIAKAGLVTAVVVLRDGAGARPDHGRCARKAAGPGMLVT